MKRGSRKNSQREHRRGDAALPDDERDAEDRGGTEAAEHERIGPAARGASMIA